MDREVAPELVKNERNRKWVIGTIIIILLITGVYFFKRSLSSSIESSRIRTGVVQTGDVENTLSATGEVIPAYEQIITSPIRASIKSVLLSPGTKVVPGQAIVELDKSLTQIEFERYQDQLELKKNSIDQLRMKLDKNLYDAEISDKIKLLNINKLRADLEDAKRLEKVGGGTKEDITRAENELKIAELEKNSLKMIYLITGNRWGRAFGKQNLEHRLKAKI